MSTPTDQTPPDAQPSLIAPGGDLTESFLSAMGSPGGGDQQQSAPAGGLFASADAPAAPQPPTPSGDTSAPAQTPPTSDLAAFLSPEPQGDQPPAQGSWDPDEWIKSVIPDPQGLADANSQQAFAQLRDSLKKAAEENKKLTEQPSVTDDLRKQIEADLVKDKFADYETLQAQHALWNNSAFAAEHQETISRIKGEQENILQQLGLDTSLAVRAAQQSGELAQARFWREHIQDEIARDILIRKGIDLTSAVQSMQDKMKSPLDHVETYKQQSVRQQQEQEQQSLQGMATRALTAHQQVAEKAARENPVYQTPFGQQLLQEIQQEYLTNKPLTETQIAEERIAARSVPSLVKYVQHLEQQVKTAADQLKQYEGLEPSPRPQQTPGGGAPAGGGLVDVAALMPNASGGLFKAQ